jgi:transketolase
MIVTNQTSTRELRLQAARTRKRLLEIIYRAGAGHTGGSLSSVDILTCLYSGIMNINPANLSDPSRDRFIMSKGHSVESLYCVLNEVGFIDNKILDTYGEYNTILAGHPTRKVPGVEVNSGALGHGLPVGVGMALGARLDSLPFRVFVLMGDGEQGEGSIYEAAMSASHYKLDNLVAIIDRNRLQISGNTEHVMAIDPVRERWQSLGWEVLECDGHAMDQLLETFQSIPRQIGKPHLVIANTVKGKGVSYMENQAKWHHGVPKKEQFEQAIEEINTIINEINK